MNSKTSDILDVILTCAVVILFRLFTHSKITVQTVFTDVLILYLFRCAIYHLDKFIDGVDEKWHERDGKSTAYHALVATGICGILLAIAIIFMYIFASSDDIPDEMNNVTNLVARLAIFTYSVVLILEVLMYQLDKNIKHIEEQDRNNKDKEEKKEGKNMNKHLYTIDPELTKEYLDTHCVCCGKPFKSPEDRNNADPLTLVGCACGDCDSKYIKKARMELMTMNSKFQGGNYSFKNTTDDEEAKRYLDEFAAKIEAENPGSKIVEIRKANILDYKAQQKSWPSKLFHKK